jgi:hypothetical protein
VIQPTVPFPRQLANRDLLVDAIYAAHPFTIATSGGLMKPLADLIMARLLLADAGLTP